MSASSFDVARPLLMLSRARLAAWRRSDASLQCEAQQRRYNDEGRVPRQSFPPLYPAECADQSRIFS